MKGWKCWLTWGIWRICGLPLSRSCGLPRPDKTGNWLLLLRVQSRPPGCSSLTSFLPSVHSAALEMELLPLWLCLGFHFLTVEWSNRSGTVTAASQGGCKLVSFPGNSELSVASVLTSLGPLGKLMDCQSRRVGNEWIRITQYLPSTMPCSSCSLDKS